MNNQEAILTKAIIRLVGRLGSNNQILKALLRKRFRIDTVANNRHRIAKDIVLQAGSRENAVAILARLIELTTRRGAIEKLKLAAEGKRISVAQSDPKVIQSVMGSPLRREILNALLRRSAHSQEPTSAEPQAEPQVLPDSPLPCVDFKPTDVSDQPQEYSEEVRPGSVIVSPVGREISSLSAESAYFRRVRQSLRKLGLDQSDFWNVAKDEWCRNPSEYEWKVFNEMNEQFSREKGDALEVLKHLFALAGGIIHERAIKSEPPQPFTDRASRWLQECKRQFDKSVALLREIKEKAIELGFVEGLMDVLEWEKSDYGEVARQAAAGPGEADYLVSYTSRRAFVIEVKRPSRSLDRAVWRQALKYSKERGVPWFVITNGLGLQVYWTRLRKPIVAFALDFREAHWRPTNRLLKLLHLLSRKAFRHSIIDDALYASVGQILKQAVRS